MEKKVFSIENKEVGTIELQDDVFNTAVSEGAVYYAINAELNNRRVGTASTKTRSEVRGSTAKPWRQKGTGRARAGRRRSPIWVGGGISFGPRPKSYNTKVTKKMKRKAMKSILSMKASDESMVVVQDFSIDSGKTREMASILKTLVGDEKTVLVLHEDHEMTKRACRNIPSLKYLSFNRLNAHDLFYCKKLVLMESSIKKLNDFYGKGANAEKTGGAE